MNPGRMNFLPFLLFSFLLRAARAVSTGIGARSSTVLDLVQSGVFFNPSLNIRSGAKYRRFMAKSFKTLNFRDSWLNWCRGISNLEEYQNFQRELGEEDFFELFNAECFNQKAIKWMQPDEIAKLPFATLMNVHFEFHNRLSTKEQMIAHIEKTLEYGGYDSHSYLIQCEPLEKLFIDHFSTLDWKHDHWDVVGSVANMSDKSVILRMLPDLSEKVTDETRLKIIKRYLNCSRAIGSDASLKPKVNEWLASAKVTYASDPVLIALLTTTKDTPLSVIEGILEAIPDERRNNLVRFQILNFALKFNKIESRSKLSQDIVEFQKNYPEYAHSSSFSGTDNPFLMQDGPVPSEFLSLSYAKDLKAFLPNYLTAYSAESQADFLARRLREMNSYPLSSILKEMSTAPQFPNLYIDEKYPSQEYYDRIIASFEESTNSPHAMTLFKEALRYGFTLKLTPAAQARFISAIEEACPGIKVREIYDLLKSRTPEDLQVPISEDLARSVWLGMTPLDEMTSAELATITLSDLNSLFVLQNTKEATPHFEKIRSAFSRLSDEQIRDLLHGDVTFNVLTNAASYYLSEADLQSFIRKVRNVESGSSSKPLTPTTPTTPSAPSTPSSPNSFSRQLGSAGETRNILNETPEGTTEERREPTKGQSEAPRDDATRKTKKDRITEKKEKPTDPKDGKLEGESPPPTESKKVTVIEEEGPEFLPIIAGLILVAGAIAAIIFYKRKQQAK